MLYHWFEMGQTAFGPARATAGAMQMLLNNPFNPLSHTAMGRGTAALCEVFERTTRRYRKPEFGIAATQINGVSVPVTENVVWETPFCRLVRFARQLPEVAVDVSADPRILIVAPMSGHFATLLRGTVQSLLPTHEVFITDWIDARTIPVDAGRFDLDDYIDHAIAMLRLFEGDVHVLAVCQPAVPVLAAVARLEEANDPAAPRSLMLMGGPVDTRVSPTAVNALAQERGIDWFRRSVIATVPWNHSGRGRGVYPGFLQLSGFMTMNLDRHIKAHKELFLNLVRGDGDSADKHKEFYDEYLAVMDLTAEFFLQTIETVFVNHDLPLGRMMYRGEQLDFKAIRRTALMTIEGANDDITGRGQCEAAHTVCSSLAEHRRQHLLQPSVGHYGIFNGSRFRREILPAMNAFMTRFEPPRAVDRPLAQGLQVELGRGMTDASDRHSGTVRQAATRPSSTGRAAPNATRLFSSLNPRPRVAN
jgi:poly(3-hydroxybutyrate) depolymerase